MKLISIALGFFLAASPAMAEFKITFDWGDIPLCTSGMPNRVGSPAFVVKDLPTGTTQIQFRLKDLDAPSYNHGGGKVKIAKDGKLPFGAFKYKSPCPPGGKHTYEWTAIAKAGNKKLATAKARRKYPE
jgi:phosphatidylethanolamine-binding protein (PEBP) family uncharacterized protein